ISRATSTTIRGITDISTRATTRKPRSSASPGARAISVLLGATLFAFAGVSPWMAAPLLLATIVFTAAVRPQIARVPDRWLDVARAGAGCDVDDAAPDGGAEDVLDVAGRQGRDAVRAVRQPQRLRELTRDGASARCRVRARESAVTHAHRRAAATRNRCRHDL